jgi:predicted nucleic acid-binding protein
MGILIDTNILIYAWDAQEKFKQTKALETLNAYRNEACLSMQNLSEFSSFMIRNQCELSWLNETLTLYRKLFNILPIQSQDIQNAVEAVYRYRMSYWDAQIWAVAKANQIPIILGENGPIGQTIEEVTYRNPFAEI